MVDVLNGEAAAIRIETPGDDGAEFYFSGGVSVNIGRRNAKSLAGNVVVRQVERCSGIFLPEVSCR